MFSIKQKQLKVVSEQIGTAVLSGSFESSSMNVLYICSIEDPFFEFHSSTYFFRRMELHIMHDLFIHSG